MRRLLHRFGVHHWSYYRLSSPLPSASRRRCWFCRKDELLVLR